MCTLDKRDNLFILTLTGDEEHLLSPIVIDSLLLALQPTTGSSPKKN
jgi:hypothetical protein